jgi:hypothetical protein
MSDHTTTTAVVATTAIAQWQPSAATTEVMPPAASPEGALIAARVLLHNPLGPDASPEVAEQWRNDVDHLIVDVINTPPHRRQRTHHSDGSPEPSPVLLCTPMAACTPSTTRIPTAASLTRMDAPPLSARARGTATSMTAMALQMPLPRGMLHIPLLLREPGADAWRIPHTSAWWFGVTSHILETLIKVIRN